MDSEMQTLIERSIRDNTVVLFMKGTRGAPQCGFSARVVQILDSLVPDYQTLNVLSDPRLRDGIKEYSSWPTIPQLYVHGEFVGGCDIVSELFESGELAQKLGVKTAPVAPPTLVVTPPAGEALAAALEGADEVIRLEVCPGFDHALSIGPQQRGDIIVETGKVRVALDKLSAGRANGVTIDYVETPQGPAFKIDNPNEPAKVQPLSVQELKQKLDAGAPLTLIDVRTQGERDIASIPGSELLTPEVTATLDARSRDDVLVFYCHHGMRSRQAAEQFLREGFKRVYNVTGGIDAWSQEIDPTIQRY
jgi:monothiol glutaredoxin